MGENLKKMLSSDLSYLGARNGRNATASTSPCTECSLRRQIQSLHNLAFYPSDQQNSTVHFPDSWFIVQSLLALLDLEC